MILLVIVTLILSACSQGKTTENKSEQSASGQTETSKEAAKPETKKFKIGINQFAEHPALDAVRTGFEEELKALGVEAEFDWKNAQADVPNATKISQKFAEDKVDLILAIATISAQTAKTATAENKIPVLFSAVTDPVSAELVASMEKPEGNLSGTTDMAPMDKQLKLFTELKPEIKKIGIIFNTGEANSEAQVKMAEEIAAGMGLEIVTIGINNINEVPQAVDAILSKADAIYTITDNIVASAINVVAKKANEAGVITIGAEKAHVEGGILMTEGLSYLELGKQTAQMAKRVLVDGADISAMPVESLKATSKAVNVETVKILGLEGAKTFAGAEEVK
ncbi:ABC transporter substrate-binding protein [Clostridiales bacterium COT073_COT-073]|nr:ABC transporter substrate-binding protein [Clostridiales bacterium COT073_COT-073]